MESHKRAIGNEHPRSELEFEPNLRQRDFMARSECRIYYRRSTIYGNRSRRSLGVPLHSVLEAYSSRGPNNAVIQRDRERRSPQQDSRMPSLRGTSSDLERLPLIYELKSVGGACI